MFRLGRSSTTYNLADFMGWSSDQPHVFPDKALPQSWYNRRRRKPTKDGGGLMEMALLATKLRIPPQPHRAVHRARLIDALERGIPDYKLALISAPAGYGKTTLLAQWAQSSG